MAQVTVYAQSDAMNWNDSSAWNKASDGSGDAITNPQNSTDTYICNLNGKTGIVPNVDVVVDSIVASDETGYLAHTSGTRSITVGAGGINYSGSNTSGMVRVSGGTLTVVGGGTGTTAVTNSSTGTAIYTTSTGAVTVTNSGGTAVSCSGNGHGVRTSSGALAVTGEVVNSYGGAAVYHNSSSLNSTFVGSVTNTGDIGYGWRHLNGTLTWTPTGVGATIDGSGRYGMLVSAGTVIVNGDLSTVRSSASISAPVHIIGGTLEYTGTRALAASADCQIRLGGGTLNLATESAKLALANSGTFVVEFQTGTLNTADAGAGAASIVNQTATSYAAILGGTDAQKAIITGPTIPAEADVKSGVDYGYVGDLQTGTLEISGLSETQMEAILDARGLTEPASDTADSVARRGASEVTLSDVGSGGGAMHSTTIATLASQTSFTLTAGSADDDAYNYCVVVVTDESTATQKCVGVISDYTGSSKTVTLGADPAIFTMAVGDTVEIYPPVGLRWINGAVASGAATVDAHVVSISDNETAADTLELFLDALDQATGQIDSGSLAAGTITAATFAADVDAEVLAWIVDNATGDGVRIDSAALNTCTGVTIPAIKDKTDNLPSDPADQSAVEAAITAAASPLATSVELAAVQTHGDSTWATATGFSTLDAADVRTALGMAAADLDDQLTAIGGTVDSLSSGVTVSDKTGFSLASDGLDAIATTAPSGPATTFREMVVQTWRWFFKRATKTSESLVTYADDGTTPITTQAITASGTDEERGAAT